MVKTTEQAQISVAPNSAWFDHNDHYMQTQEKLECYRNIRRMVERELHGIDRVLDVGNGGFFNYDPSLVGHVTAVDLFLQDGPGPFPNVMFRRGSFLELPCADGSFDCVLQQNVLHHVVGRTVADNLTNMKRCLAEMYRCLRPGGKAVAIESTVGPVFYQFQQAVFRPLTWVKRRGHPVTFQFTARQLLGAARECGFRVEEYANVPRGAFIMQFGHVWPCLLTPAQPIKLILSR
jgi:SAM-dependent methyltransferase